VTRRNTGAIHSVNGATLFADTFTQWDPSGRPVVGVRSQTGICNVPLTIAYDDVARTMTETASSSGSILCGVASTFETVAYDANGSVVSDTASAGGTTTTVSNAISTRQQICK
jgi:hypothetical protein